MQLSNGWHEIDDEKRDYRKGLEHCTIRITRTTAESTEWLLEITVSYLMVGTMRQMYVANTVEEAFEKAEILTVEKFAELKGYYIRLLRELD